jgi:hypothetical protein
MRAKRVMSANLPRTKTEGNRYHVDALLLTKWASDAALDMGDSAYALGMLKPLVQANFQDWQAVSMLARAAAESGDKQTRDAAMMNMVMLRQHGMTPPNMTQYVLERMKVGGNVMTFRCSLVPWGPYKAYYVGQVADAKGATFLLISLESSDADQVVFAKQHAKEAAAGFREFTLDAYRETGLNQAGQRTQTHSSLGFALKRRLTLKNLSSVSSPWSLAPSSLSSQAPSRVTLNYLSMRAAAES